MRKLMFVTIVLMFGLASSATAADFNWTNWMAPDNLWTTNGNWDVAGSPGAADAAKFDDTTGMANEAIINSSMSITVDYLLIGRGGGGTNNALRMTGGTLNINNRAYMADSADAGSVGTFTLEGGTVTITGLNSSDRKFYVGYKGGLVTPSKGYFNISGGLLDSVGKFYVAGEKSGSEAGWGQVTQSGGTINVDEGSSRVRIGGKEGTGTYIMSGGTLYSADDVIVADGTGSTGLLDMTGGYIRADGDFKVGSGDSGSAIVNLHGGIISAGNLSFDTDMGSMDIKYGTMILDGDEADEVQALVDGGYITAYSGAGEVLVNYWASQDLTIVNAIIPEPATIALLGLGGLLIRRRR
jgi:hypothetical protein